MLQTNRPVIQDIGLYFFFFKKEDIMERLYIYKSGGVWEVEEWKKGITP